MNRYPAWRYALIAFAIAAAFLYTLPNFFGESPAVQVSSGKTTVKVDPALLGTVALGLLEGMAAGLTSLAQFRGSVPFVIILAVLLWSQRKARWDDAR